MNPRGFSCLRMLRKISSTSCRFNKSWLTSTRKSNRTSSARPRSAHACADLGLALEVLFDFLVEVNQFLLNRQDVEEILCDILKQLNPRGFIVELLRADQRLRLPQCGELADTAQQWRVGSSPRHRLPARYRRGVERPGRHRFLPRVRCDTFNGRVQRRGRLLITFLGLADRLDLRRDHL